MQKRIQIQYDLYGLMVEYILDHYDANDLDRYHRIVSGIDEKRKAMTRHNVYTVYKMAKDQETKEIARKMYLEEAGIHPDFQW